MNILHLSDIHFEDNNKSSFNETFTEIKCALQKEDKKIDLILITGDLINRGGGANADIRMSFKAFDESIIKKLMNDFSIERDHIIIAPGNHDIDRKRISTTEEVGLLHRCIDEDFVKEIIQNGIQTGRYEGDERLVAYKEYNECFYSEYKNVTLTPFYSSHIVSLEGKTIGIVAFNTVWRCGGTDEKLILGLEQVLQAIEKINRCDIKIGLFHNHLNFIEEFDRQETKARICKTFDLGFFGHVHEHNWENIQTTGGHLVELTSAGVLTNNKYIEEKGYNIGFSITEISNDSVFPVFYKWSKDKATFIKDESVNPDEPLKWSVSTNTNLGYEVEYQMASQVKKEFITENEQITNFSEMKKHVNISTLFEAKGILFNHRNEITEILDKVLFLKKTELQTWLIVGDKLLETEDEICSEIQKMIFTLLDNRHIFDRGEIENIISVIEQWHGFINNCIADSTIEVMLENCSKINEKSAEYINMYRTIENDIDMIEAFIESNGEIRKRRMFMLLIIYPLESMVGNKKCKTQNISEEKNLSGFVEREIEQQIFNSIKSNERTYVYGKNGVGKTIMAKNIKRIINSSENNEIAIYYSTKAQIIYENVKLFLNEYNSVSMIKANSLSIDENFSEKDLLEILDTALKNLGLEYATVYVIIDDLDDLNEGFKRLLLKVNNKCQFLFIFNGEKLTSEITNKEEKTINVVGLNKDEIITYTNLTDDTVEQIAEAGLTDFYSLDQLLNRSKEEIETFINQNQTNKEKGLYLNAIKWLREDKKYYEELLILLTLFFNICALSLEQLQRYMVFKEIQIKKPYITNVMNEMSLQLMEDNQGKIRLKDRDFVKYVCSNFFSKYDMENALENVFSWVETMDYDEAETIAFVINGKKVFEKNEILVDKLRLHLKEKLLNDSSGELLFSVGKRVLKESEENTDLALAMFQKADICEVNEATEALMGYYFDKDNFDSFSKAKEYSIKAIATGSEKAKFYYVFGILERKFIGEDDNIQKAMQYLEDLAGTATDEFIKKRSQLLYCIHSLRGIKSKYSRIEAIDELKKLINNDELAEMFYLKILVEEKNPENTNKAKIIFEKYEKRERIRPNISVQLVKIYLDKESEFYSPEKVVKYIETQKDSMCVDMDELVVDAYYDMKFIDEAQGIVRGYIEEKLKEDNDNIKLFVAKGKIFGKQELSDCKTAEKLLYELINKGNADAMFCMGRYLLRQEETRQQAIEMLENAVEFNSLGAKMVLSRVYLDKTGKSFSEERGLMFLRSLSKAGVIEAEIELDEYLIKNRKPDSDMAYKNMESFADSENIIAMRTLGEICFNKRSNYNDCNKGEKYLNRAAKRGDERSIASLGQRYLFGVGVKKNIEKGIKWLNIGISNEDEFCMEILGHAIMEREISFEPMKKGAELILKAVDKNDIWAKTHYGFYLCSGCYFSQDKKLGEQMLREAAVSLDEAKYVLAKMKLDGKYLKKDSKEGEKYLVEAANNNYVIAQVEYAERLIHGNNIKEDVSKGVDILKRLIYSNADIAKISYAKVLLSSVLGVKEDDARDILEKLIPNNSQAKKVYGINILEKRIDNRLEKKEREKKAIRYLESCSNEGDIEATFILGKALVEGILITQNITKGISLLEKGVECDDADCLCFLGDCLLKGEYVNRDNQKGETYIKRAIKQGYSLAKYKYAKYNIEQTCIHTPNMEEGWKLIDELVDDNYVQAEIYKAKAYIKGCYCERNIAKGIELFDSLVEREEDGAADVYSELLINNQYIPRDIEKSSKLLQNIMKGDNGKYARYEKVQRMFNKEWTNNSIKKAIRELDTLAKKSYEKAELDLAFRKLTGTGLVKEEKHSKEKIEKIIKDVDFISAMDYGMHAYRFQQYAYASDLFKLALTGKTFEARNALAYLLRRNFFVGDHSNLSVELLLQPLLENKYPIAIINYALYLVQDTADDNRWHEADDLIKSINGYDDAAEWWFDLMNKGDDEGRLVIAWLIRNGKYFDNDLDLKEKLVKSIDKGQWKIPKWF